MSLLEYGIELCWKCVIARRKIHDELLCDTQYMIDVTFESAHGRFHVLNISACMLPAILSFNQ